METESRKLRLALAAACCALVAVPFLVVRFPPVSDLPQHAAQVRLFVDAVTNPATVYRVQWLTPYSLVYVLLGGCWAAFGPAAAGRVCMLLIVVAWAAAAHWLARRRGRPAVCAVVASLVSLNLSVYWGFYSFLAGWLVFVVWVLFTVGPQQELRARDVAKLVAASLALYFTHALWFAAGLAWLAIATLLYRPPIRVALGRFVCAAPTVALAAVWFAGLAGSNFATPPIWPTRPWERLTYPWFADSLFGGIKGPMVYGVFAGILLWMGVALWQNRAALRESVDVPLLAGAAFFLLAALLLPNKYQNTIQFAERWLAPAFVLLLLGLPAPRANARLLSSASLGLLAAFALASALVWTAFEQSELSGLDAAVDALPPSPQRVLGLDFVKDSPTMMGRPFLQDFAYAQVMRGGRLSFSFAEFAPMFVVFKSPPPPHPWTPALEWFAETVKASDFQYFDYVIVNGADDVHEVFAADGHLEPVTATGRFRLYRVMSSPVRP